jgi:hypothetical protein
MPMPEIRRLVRAAIGVAAATVGARVVAGPLPDTIGLVPAVGVALCVPGWALLHTTRLNEHLNVVEAVALLPVAGPAAWAPALVLGLAAHLPFTVVLGLVLVGSVLGLAVQAPAPAPVGWRELGAVLGAGVVTCLLAARWRRQLVGDAFFHTGRIRKLIDLPHLSLSGLSAYRGGHPHAGYAVPLLHAVEAGVIRIGGLDPADAYTALATTLGVFVPVAAYAAGRALGGRTVGTVAGTLQLWVSLTGGIQPLGFSYTEQPGPYAFRLLIPAIVLLVAVWYRSPSDRRLQSAVVAAVGVVTVVHPTYAFPALAVLAGVVVTTRQGWGMLAAAAAGAATYAGWVWWVALHGAQLPHQLPGVNRFYSYAAHHPVLVRGSTVSGHVGEFLLGLVAVCALLVYRRGRFGLAAATSVGGLALVAVPGVTALVVPLVGAGQALRMGFGVPIIYPTALALVLVAAAETRSRLLAIAAVTAGLSLALAGDGFPWTWPSLVTSVTAVASVFGVVVAATGWASKRPVPLPPAPIASPLGAAAILTAALLAGSMKANAGEIANTILHGRPPVMRTHHLVSPGVVRFMRLRAAGRFPVVLAPFQTGRYVDVSYQLVADADVYVVALDSTRTRSEPLNHPDRRRAAVTAFYKSVDSAAGLAILRRYSVWYVVVDVSRTPDAAARLDSSPEFRVVYRDGPVAPRYDHFAVFEPVGPIQ